jgi:hypothetical protein
VVPAGFPAATTAGARASGTPGHQGVQCLDPRSADEQRIDLQRLQGVAEPLGQPPDARDDVGHRVQVGGLGAARAAQQRAAAQLADITAGERLELAELLVAVRTIRGLQRR